MNKLKDTISRNKEAAHKTIVVIGIVIVIFWLGRLSVYYQQVSDTPIREIPEFNEHVPMVNIMAVRQGRVEGYVSDTKTRVKSWNKTVAVPDEGGRFVLDIRHLGYLGPTQELYEHVVPEWAVYVSSKNGKNFYKVDSGSGRNISVPNRLYFRSKEEAIEKGFNPGSGLE
jgi:hypothetical protein